MAAIVVVGSVNEDLVVRVPRLPRTGETVTGGEFVQAHGGKGANQAAAAARLGARTWLVATVGPDPFGAAARADLEAFGVDCSHLAVGTAPTGVAAILVGGHGENLIAVASGANRELGGDPVRRALGSIAGSLRARDGTPVVLANLEIGDEAVLAAATGARERGWPFVLNPGPARPVPPAVLAACAALTPNEHEVDELGAPGVEGLLAAGAAAVVVTRGGDGAEIHRLGARARMIPAFPVEAADTTGAGDAFTATLAWGLARGQPLDRAVRLATAGGALATRRVGARSALPTREEIEALAAGGRAAAVRRTPAGPRQRPDPRS